MLAKASQLADIPSDLRTIDDTIRGSSSLKAKLKAIGRKKALFEELSRKHEEHEVISLKEGLTYAETLSKTITKPLDPSRYSALLILQPTEWLKKWWLRRPLVPLFRVDSKVRRIDDYGRLIQRLWGSELNANVLKLYKMHADTIEKQFYTF